MAEKHTVGDGDADELLARFVKERVFVRELKGVYGDVFNKLLAQPRVYKTRGAKWNGGPRAFSRNVINPQSAEITQMIECHLDVYAPNSYGQKHGHMNSAVFYILEGKGHDVHDGVRYDWEAGDVCVVENACVHCHYNDNPAQPVRVLVMKAKPLALFAHLLYQKVVEYTSKEPVPGFEEFYPSD